MSAIQRCSVVSSMPTHVSSDMRCGGSGCQRASSLAAILGAINFPLISEVASWDGEHFARALRHVPGDLLFNPDFRQFIHVAFKIAAEMGARYREALKANTPIVSRFVTANIYERHLLPIFGELNEVESRPLERRFYSVRVTC